MSDLTNASPTATPAERLERLLFTCRLMQKNLNQLLCALDIVDDSIPDRDNEGLALSGLVQMIMTRQNEEYSDFTKEISIAAGEVA